ncbi:MAG: hypothetical protein NWS68_02245, partial [Erythrobacter sp.]|nr:hypothetical protein [Erythrobacter sp.]
MKILHRRRPDPGNLLALLLLGTSLLAAPLAAQETPGAAAELGEPAPATTTRSTFAPEDFARFAPRSALSFSPCPLCTSE